MATTSPLYTPLGDPSSNIRLLEINVRDSPRRPRVTCRMRTVSLDSAPPYYALSYVWGDPTERKNIVINSQLVSVTKNLEDALRCAPQLQDIDARPDRTFLLWADAICIDQNNSGERAAQLSLMAKLYQDAECVFAWLGSEDENEAFRALRPVINEINHMNQQDDINGGLLDTFAALQWLSSYPSLCQNDVLVLQNSNIQNIPTLYNACWSAINDLLSREYWSRAWVFQEAVLARRLILACPTSAMVFTDLGSVAMVLDAVQWYLRKLPVVKPDFLGSAVWYFLRDILDWSPIVQIMRERNYRSSVLSSDERARRCALSTVGFDLRATDPRDHVYSLLALTNLEIEPDYEKSLSQIYIEYSQVWLKTFQSKPLQPELRFLAYGGVGMFDEEPSLPSWVPNFRDQLQTKVKILGGRADKGIFGVSTPSASINVDNKSLVAPGVEVHSISKVHGVPQVGDNELHMSRLMEEIKGIHTAYSKRKSPLNLGEQSPSALPSSELAPGTKSDMKEAKKGYFKDLYQFSVNFALRNQLGYLKRIPPLQAILRVIWSQPMSQKVFGPTVMRGLNFLKLLSIYGPHSTPEANIQGLGFALDDGFDPTFHAKVFPVDEVEWPIRSLLDEFNDWAPIGGLTEMMEIEAHGLGI
ncbi:hypothetical protein G7Z17_g4574 [Cylindrodendrum hubeiense]|uniref:Heterokaryon incompatibility domain-containing protein n=1 Tax=Cylindrodendrum hubeiense TaxID=595255 RepID=A0A9P5H8H5_9HYPO|nr:hypothetical protein G7Z17_g4574 [Cylindrodendrum hubeiense]